MRLILTVVLVLGCQIITAETPFSDDLKNGRFQKILKDKEAVGTGEFAWARFYLISDPGTYEAALEPHQKGDILGSFILLKCHRGGIGIRKDDAVKSKLNFDIRTALEKNPKPNPIENYMLSYLLPGNAFGIVTGDDPEKMTKDEFNARNSRWFHLNASANAGFAQAMDEVGFAMQRHDEQSGFEWYEKAAKTGLASGMKNLGFLYAVSPTRKDAAKAVEWTRKAAQAGDIYAMVNMGAFVDKKVLDNISIKEAQNWINSAEKTGHSLGYLEKGLALLTGNYQFPVDREAGIDLLQKAAETGDSFSLAQISMFYEQGFGLERNLKKATEYSEAAYVQGDLSAAGTLFRIYVFRSGTDPSLQPKVDFWKFKSMGENLAYGIGLNDDHPDLVKSLKEIDPYSLQVD